MSLVVPSARVAASRDAVLVEGVVYWCWIGAGLLELDWLDHMEWLTDAGWYFRWLTPHNAMLLSLIAGCVSLLVLLFIILNLLLFIMFLFQ